MPSQAQDLLWARPARPRISLHYHFQRVNFFYVPPQTFGISFFLRWERNRSADILTASWKLNWCERRG